MAIVVRGRRRIRWRTPSGRIQQLSLHVRTVGESGPPTLLLHGFTGSHRYWGGAFDELGRDGVLVVPDLLGFGGSQRPSTGFSVDDHVDALVSCLAELGISEPCVVGAHSLGCLVAFRLAARHRLLVAGVVAFGPPLYRDAWHARRRIARLGVLERLFVLDTAVSRRACEWVCAHRTWAARLAVLARPELPASIVRDSVRHTWPSYSGTLRGVLLRGEGLRWLEETRCPVHLVVGERDRIADRGVLEELARRRASVDLSVVPGGHDLPLTDPDRCVEHVRALVGRTTSR